MEMKNPQIYRCFLKRPFDFVISATAIATFSPFIFVIAILVRVFLGSPVLFKQRRPGLNGKIFYIYKFRTMTDKRDKTGCLLPDEKRLTRFGRFLRSTSLDELPELLNIFIGDMSLVGPRPLLVKYLLLYNAEQSRRHEVRPGLTGLAQINGRNAISWQERFKWDVKYVDSVTFIMDIKILFKTIGSILRRENITSATSMTMEEFTGNKDD